MQDGFLSVATRPSIVRRAFRVAVIVGLILGAINHGDRILDGAMAPTDWLKFALTFAVPYMVSTWSSVMAAREAAR